MQDVQQPVRRFHLDLSQTDEGHVSGGVLHRLDPSAAAEQIQHHSAVHFEEGDASRKLALCRHAHHVVRRKGVEAAGIAILGARVTVARHRARFAGARLAECKDGRVASAKYMWHQRCQGCCIHSLIAVSLMEASVKGELHILYRLTQIHPDLWLVHGHSVVVLLRGYHIKVEPVVLNL